MGRARQEKQHRSFFSVRAPRRWPRSCELPASKVSGASRITRTGLPSSRSSTVPHPSSPPFVQFVAAHPCLPAPRGLAASMRQLRTHLSVCCRSDGNRTPPAGVVAGQVAVLLAAPPPCWPPRMRFPPPVPRRGPGRRQHRADSGPSSMLQRHRTPARAPSLCLWWGINDISTTSRHPGC